MVPPGQEKNPQYSEGFIFHKYTGLLVFRQPKDPSCGGMSFCCLSHSDVLKFLTLEPPDRQPDKYQREKQDGHDWHEGGQRVIPSRSARQIWQLGRQNLPGEAGRKSLAQTFKETLPDQDGNWDGYGRAS